jgi:hypothetical protein
MAAPLESVEIGIQPVSKFLRQDGAAPADRLFFLGSLRASLAVDALTQAGERRMAGAAGAATTGAASTPSSTAIAAAIAAAKL